MLFPFTEHDFDRLRLRRLHARVASLHPQTHEVTLDDGRRLPYDRLLLATGSLAAIPPLPGVDLDGVVKLDDLDDARRILKRCRRGRTAVVVGGGITALEIVEGLRARNVRTHYFLRGERYWSNVLDETESRIVEHRLQEEGVQIHYHTELAEILGKRGRVAGVLTQDGHRIDCALVAIAIGVRPRTELAEGAGLATERGIQVDEYLQTSAPDVFAAGDAAQVFDPFSGKSVLDTLWGVAVTQGRIAGQNMAGQAMPYHKAVPFNVTRLAGLTTTIIGTVGRGRDKDLLGIARGDSETWRQLPDALVAQNAFDVNRSARPGGRAQPAGGDCDGRSDAVAAPATTSSPARPISRPSGITCFSPRRTWGICSPASGRTGGSVMQRRSYELWSALGAMLLITLLYLWVVIAPRRGAAG